MERKGDIFRNLGCSKTSLNNFVRNPVESLCEVQETCIVLYFSLCFSAGRRSACHVPYESTLIRCYLHNFSQSLSNNAPKDHVSIADVPDWSVRWVIGGLSEHRTFLKSTLNGSRRFIKVQKPRSVQCRCNKSFWSRSERMKTQFSPCSDGCCHPWQLIFFKSCLAGR